MNARDRAGARYAPHGHRRDLARVLGYGIRVAPRLLVKAAGRRGVRRWHSAWDGVRFAQGAGKPVWVLPVAARRIVADARFGALVRHAARVTGIGRRRGAGGVGVVASVRRIDAVSQQGTMMRRAGGPVVWSRVGRRSGDAMAGVVPKGLGVAARRAMGVRRRVGSGDRVGRHMRVVRVFEPGRETVVGRSVAPVARGRDRVSGETLETAIAREAGRDGWSSGLRQSWPGRVDERQARVIGLDAPARGMLSGRVNRGSESALPAAGHGDLAMVGSRDVARSVGSLFADEARRPPSGVTGFDGRLSPFFAGRKPGF